jgi:NTE family protein
VRIHAAARRLAVLLAFVLMAGAGARAQAPSAAAAASSPLPAAAASASVGAPDRTAAAGPHRTKVCLVLSGGGARGAAHVGVLRVLEELHVPIDCITGTSMGSIVGGAYASGTPLDQMEKTVDSMSTRLLFTELPPREERAVRLKKDDATILSPLEIGVKGGDILLPKGLVSGVQLESVLRGLSKVRGFQHFDDLPIPFRAVATDLVTGRAVVLSEGELASAMRASMSVPAAIEPVHLGDHLLVDGGLTNNLPIDVARAMGADVVIAVNLGTPLMRPEQLTSVLGVTGQMVNILTEQNVQASLASLKPTDILVLPELGDFSAADFDHLPQTIPIGEAAARKVADRLAAYAVPQAEYDAWQARRQSRLVAELGTVDEIRFAPQPNVNTEMARAVMQTKPGEPIDQAELDRDMRRIYGTGDYEHVSYQILEEPGKRILNVNAVEKSWGPDYLRLGLGLSSDFRGDAYFNLLGSYRMRWINQLGAEWRNDLQIGRTNRAYTEFYQPIEQSQTLFIVPSLEAQRRPVDVYEGTQRVARFDIADWAASLEAGAQFTRYGEMRLGITSTEVRTTLDTGSSFLAVTNSREHYTLLTLRGLADQLDNVNFPRNGYAGSYEIISSRSGLGSDAEFSRGEFSGTAFTSWGRNTLSTGVKFGGRLGNDPIPPIGLFSWGGLLQQSGYPTGALVGDNVRFGRLVYTRQLQAWSILDGVYGGFSLEVGRVGKPLVPNNEQGTLKSMALFLGVDTPIGPLYFGYGRTETGISSGYLYLGRP